MKITLEIPDPVYKLLTALGHDQSWYQYDFNESLRSWLDTGELVGESPAVDDAKTILEKANNKIKESWQD